jgi:hypothetical protein
MVDANLSLADMLCMQAHLSQLETAAKQKSAWDDRTPATDFNIGDIVQWHNGKLDNSYKSENKLLPHWSLPYIISGKSLNSYTLSTLHGTEIPGSFHSCRLRQYVPLRNSNLSLLFPNTPTIHQDNQNQFDLEEAEERMATEWSMPSSLEELPDCSAE